MATKRFELSSRPVRLLVLTAYTAAIPQFSAALSSAGAFSGAVRSLALQIPPVMMPVSAPWTGQDIGATTALAPAIAVAVAAPEEAAAPLLIAGKAAPAAQAAPDDAESPESNLLAAAGLFDGFPAFYRSFTADLDRRFTNDYGRDSSAFLNDVEQGRFHEKKPGVGELEAKIIDGQAALRFVPENADAAPLAVLWVNVPLAVNAGLPTVQVRPRSAAAGSGPDEALGSRHLDTYRSRLLINRKIDFRRLFKDGRLGPPHRAVLIVDQDRDRVVDTVFSPALAGAPRRWLRHWIKGTIEGAGYGDVARGTVSAAIQVGLAYLLAGVGQALHPSAHPHLLAPALLSGAFAWVFSVFTDSYVAFVQRGDNRAWESAKRLLVAAAFLSYPLALMQAGGAWSTLWSPKTTMLVFLVGFGDRYLSTVMNVVPKIQQKYFMKPWFFPVRVKTPLGDFLARLTGRESFRAKVKGVTWTREALAIARFPVKFSGLLLDPLLMHWTHGVPVTSILLWLCGIPFEIINYRTVKRLALNNPRIQEDLKDLAEHYRRIPLLGRLSRAFRSK